MDKQWYKDRIYGYECRAVGEITTALLNHDYKNQILKRLRKELSKLTFLSPAEYQSVWIWTVNTYNKISKGSWGDKTGERLARIAAKQYRAMEAEKNLVADSIEFRFKHDRALRYISDGVVFYRCSTHKNCAEGHLKYQGQIFINSDAASESEMEYAEQHGILPIRNVLFEDPYLTTRRNCKHHFIPVTAEEVMENKLPPVQVIAEEPLDSRYRAYYDRKKLLIAAGISKENDSYKRTVSLINKYKL